MCTREAIIRLHVLPAADAPGSSHAAVQQVWPEPRTSNTHTSQGAESGTPPAAGALTASPPRCSAGVGGVRRADVGDAGTIKGYGLLLQQKNPQRCVRLHSHSICSSSSIGSSGGGSLSCSNMLWPSRG